MSHLAHILLRAMTPLKRATAFILFGFGLIVLSLPNPALAQDVQLNPVEISGEVQIGTEALNRFTVTARSGTFLATKNVNLNPETAGPIPYTMTVDVPVDGNRTYTVQVCPVNSESSNDNVCFAAQSVYVEDGTPGTADFVVQNPAIIEGTFTVIGGYDFNASLVGQYTTTNYPNCYSSYAPCFNTGTNSYPSAPTAAYNKHGLYRIAVEAGSAITLKPRIGVNLNSGWTTFPLPHITVAIDPGQTLVQNFSFTPPDGSISGNISISGAETPNRLSISATGAANKSLTLTDPADITTGNYDLAELIDGSYYLNTYAYFGPPSYTTRHTFYFPISSYSPSRSPTISSGSHEVVNISAEQAYIDGQVDLYGSATFDDVTSLQMLYLGASTATSGGQAHDNQADSGTGGYRIIASAGDWRPYRVYTRFEPGGAEPADNFRETLYVYLYGTYLEPLTLAAGQTLSDAVDLPMGKVTVNFSVIGGLPLSNPFLSIGCSLRDDTNALLLSFSGSSYANSQYNVTNGVVSFFAPEGACTVRAQATVNGTTTSFGEFSIDVDPGVTKEVDIGAPTLNVVYPEPNLLITTSPINVHGTATDDLEVASVTVNGTPASLTDAANPTDPVEVNFTSPLALSPGWNTITTIATDTSDKSSTDTRTVCFDAGPPTANWSPATDSSTSLLTINVSGTMDDDLGVASATMNGDTLILSPTGNQQNPQEVSFATTADLVPGPNSLELIVTDDCGRTTSQTHVVTVNDNSPPNADANGPYTVNEGSSTTLDGSASSDPDGDDLSFDWDLDNNGSFETAGATPTFSAATLDGPSSHTVALRISDTEGASATTTATINVANVAPDAGVIILPLAPLMLGTAIDVSAPYSDPGQPDTHTVVWTWGDGQSSAGTATGGSATGTHTYAESGIYKVTCTVTDDDGASDTCDAAASYVAIYNPDGGFVTGGGWIASPTGAYTTDPSLTGKASFGFVAKYNKGAHAPTGSTEFQLHAGDLNFHTSSGQWLVIAGARAQFKGLGTINGSGSYGFMLTAIDGAINGGGGVDKFRIKIWDTGSGALVYDNELGTADDGAITTALTAGSIVIHNPGGKK